MRIKKSISSASSLRRLAKTPHLYVASLSFLLFTNFAFAKSSDYRVGAGIGFGGTGIKKTVDVAGGTRTVERAENPGTFQIFIDKPWSEKWLVGLEHTRGFRLGPFSMGLGFTGLAARWYYLSPYPDLLNTYGTESTIYIKRWAPYVGYAGGIASGQITRDGAEPRTVTSSGVYLGFRAGADLLWRPNIGLRAELSYSQTFISSSSRFPADLNAFSLWSGLFISL